MVVIIGSLVFLMFSIIQLIYVINLITSYSSISKLKKLAYGDDESLFFKHTKLMLSMMKNIPVNKGLTVYLCWVYILYFVINYLFKYDKPICIFIDVFIANSLILIYHAFICISPDFYDLFIVYFEKDKLAVDLDELN